MNMPAPSHCSEHSKFSFPAQVTMETKFFMLCLKMFVLYLEADTLCGMEGWDLKEAQTAISKRERSKEKAWESVQRLECE